MRSSLFFTSSNRLLGIKIRYQIRYKNPALILFIKLWKVNVIKWSRNFYPWSKYISHFSYNHSAHLLVYFHRWKQRHNFSTGWL